MQMNSSSQGGLTVEFSVAQRDVAVSFTVPAGNVLALLGPNGSGKSTTLMALAGWLIPDVGRASLHGKCLFDCAGPGRQPNVWVPAEHREIGYLSQEHHLFPHLSVLDNIMYGMQRSGLTSRRARQAAAEHWLERVGLPNFGKHKPHQLSGGQAQRVAIARILASGPRLVLLDEPFAALDVKAALALRELLAEVIQDLTVILVTHHQADVDALADETYRLTPSP